MLGRMSPSARCPGSCPPLRGSCFRAPLPRCGPTVATERDHPKYGRGAYLRVCGGCLPGSLPRGRKSARNRYRGHASCQRFLGIATEGAHLDSLVGIRAPAGTGWPPGDSIPHKPDAWRQCAAQTGRSATANDTDSTVGDRKRAKTAPSCRRTSSLPASCRRASSMLPSCRRTSSLPASCRRFP